MHYIIIKSLLLNRWRVYAMGHTDGDRTWLATFRNAADAAAWTGNPHSLDPSTDTERARR